jgi:predicted lipoprotein with Yx(FWY)xxD motif
MNHRAVRLVSQAVCSSSIDLPRGKHMRVRIGVLGAALLTAALAACSSGGGDGAAQPAQPAKPVERAQRALPATPAAPAETGAPSGVTVEVSTTSLGPILTDQNGRTLYALTTDKGGTSSCGDDCINVWPALVSKAPVEAGRGTTPTLFGTTERTEGATQATYGEWPLYYYAGDQEPGDVDGQGVDGVWFVVGADGELIRSES